MKGNCYALTASLDRSFSALEALQAYMPKSAPTKIAPNTPAASVTRRPAAALVVTSAGADYPRVSWCTKEVDLVLTAVKLALALVLGEGTPDTEELSVPFAMTVG